jgi:hypothetical protein
MVPSELLATSRHESHSWRAEYRTQTARRKVHDVSTTEVPLQPRYDLLVFTTFNYYAGQISLV